LLKFGHIEEKFNYQREQIIKLPSDYENTWQFSGLNNLFQLFFLVHYSNSLFINKYAQIALIATDYIPKGASSSEAWEKSSSEIFEKGSSSQKKGCTKNALLGLYG